MTASAELVHDLAPTGALRASINLGNPVLAQGTPESPSGVTVDLAREVAARLGVPLELVCFDAARKSLAALTDGRADLCFLAVDPARAAEVAFTAPYVVIEGVFVVPADSDVTTVADVDRAGVRIGVKEGSAYDLFLTRTLEHATVVRGEEGVDVFREQGLEAGAGIRQPMTAYAGTHPEVRVVEERFMQIQQAVGTTIGRAPATVAFLRDLVEELKASGFVADALRPSASRRDGRAAAGRADRRGRCRGMCDVTQRTGSRSSMLSWLPWGVAARCSIVVMPGPGARLPAGGCSASVPSVRQLSDVSSRPIQPIVPPRPPPAPRSPALAGRAAVACPARRP